MPRSGEAVRARLQQAALELITERGYDQTTAGMIATRAGVTERTFFRHFADKREMFFDGEAELRELLVAAVAAVPPRTRPLPTLRAAFHAAVPLIERNRPVTEPRARLLADTPALRERSLAKTAALVAALTEALRARGVEPPAAALCAQVGMDTFGIATHRWMQDPSTPLPDRLDQAFQELRREAAALR
jgi:AcrR family transcriptional regulator